MNARRLTRQERVSAAFWPAFIVFLLALPIAAATVLVRAATSDPSVAVEENYYERGLAWDEVARQRAANEALGWGIELLAGRAGDGRLFLQARLLDAAGAPIVAEALKVEAFAIARAADRLLLDLDPGEDGTWEAAAAASRGGLWEFRCEVLARGERFTQVLRRDLSPGGVGP